MRIPSLRLACSLLLAGLATHTLRADPASTVPDGGNYLGRPPYKTQYADYLELMRGRRVDVIFIGDSITEQFRWGVGKPVWDKHYASRALNFGLGSDRTQHAIWRLQNLPISEFSPKVAVILIGTNNFEDTPEDIAAGVRAVISAAQTRFPGVKIVLTSILPNARATEKMAAANRLLAPLHDGKTIHFLDLSTTFEPVGESWKGLWRDKLHLTAEGYEMWASALDPLLEKIMN